MKNKTIKYPGLREEKRLQLRKKIQQKALSLFIKQGYSNTTVEQIAKAVTVSHMSIFRYFPTKESIVLDDQSEELIASLIKKQPKSTTAINKIETAILEAVSYIYPQEKDRMLTRMRLIMNTPDLRAKMWDKQISTAKVISKALSDSTKQSFQLYVMSAVCVAAMTIAVEEWVISDDKKDLLILIKKAFKTLSNNNL
jgi:AcrR family transcriptional regulator